MQRFAAKFSVTIAVALMLIGPRVVQAQAKGEPQASRLPQVSLDGGYFVANGKRFIPVGAHWVPAKAAMQWTTQWNPKDIEADFAKMHELGYTVTRFDVMWAWFEPRRRRLQSRKPFNNSITSSPSPTNTRSTFTPRLFIGGEVGEAFWDVSWRHGRNPHTDPDMLMWETNFAE